MDTINFAATQSLCQTTIFVPYVLFGNETKATHCDLKWLVMPEYLEVHIC
jgi:hypothetical protein